MQTTDSLRRVPIGENGLQKHVSGKNFVSRKFQASVTNQRRLIEYDSVPNLPFIGVEPRRIMTWSPIPIPSTGQDTPLATNSAKTSIAQSKPRGGGTLKYEMQESRMREKAISQNLGRE